MRRLPVTEAAHPAGSDLERLSSARLVSRLHAGDREATVAVGRALAPIAALADRAAAALRAGGRLVYVGAGTSGRLGALDAAECPPTFGVAPSRVLALVAGGSRALRRAVEGAEDDRGSARAAVRDARIGPRDIVVGVSASGTTPFVLAALSEARRLGARTALVTSNPAARAAADLRVVLATGPERIAGSTRMKAGTAAKMALGLVSTAAFVQLGAVRAGRMVALRAGSEKLRARALRNVAALAGVSAGAARGLLDRTGWDVGAAIALAAGGAGPAPLDSATSLPPRRHARGGGGRARASSPRKAPRSRRTR